MPRIFGSYKHIKHTWAGKKSVGGFLPIPTCYSFDFDSGVGIPVTLTFWPGGGVNTLANSPPPQRPCVISSRYNIILLAIIIYSQF